MTTKSKSFSELDQNRRTNSKLSRIVQHVGKNSSQGKRWFTVHIVDCQVVVPVVWRRGFTHRLKSTKMKISRQIVVWYANYAIGSSLLEIKFRIQSPILKLKIIPSKAWWRITWKTKQMLKIRMRMITS